MSENKDATENLDSSQGYASVDEMLSDIAPEVIGAYRHHRRAAAYFRLVMLGSGIIVGYSIPEIIAAAINQSKLMILVWFFILVASLVLWVKAYRRLYA